MRSYIQSHFFNRCLTQPWAVGITAAMLLVLPLLSGCDCSAADDAYKDGSGGYLDGAGGDGIKPPKDGEAEISGVIKDGPKKLDILWSDILGSNTDGPPLDKGGGIGPVVSTLAGTAKSGHKNGLAATAQFNFPTGLAVDKNESVYVADQNNNRIRVVFNKQVADVAGSGAAGYADGASAVAKFFDPMDVAVDSKGNVYVADQNNDRVRLIAGGKVSTLAGSGTIGHKDGPAASAQFDTPIDLVVDTLGTVYVADQNNHSIRVITGGTVKTRAGDGYTGYKDGPVAVAQFNFPTGVALGPSGKLYVADQINARIRVITW